MGKHRKRRRSSSSSDSDESSCQRKERKLEKKLEKLRERRQQKELAGNGKSADQHDTNTELAEDIHLDEGMLKVLGAPPVDTEAAGVRMHTTIAKVWGALLSNGLEDTSRVELMEKYPKIKNCPLLIAPKINPEILKSLKDKDLPIKRDSRLVNVQNQVGVALAGALSALVTDDEESDETSEGPKLFLVESISDAARLLCGVHHEQSITRRHMMKPLISDSFKDTLTEGSIDGWLFGDNLSERIKSAKALGETGEELKKQPTKPKSTAPVLNKSPRTNNLNFNGPPRFQKGPARGGLQKKSYRGSSHQSQRSNTKDQQSYQRPAPSPHWRRQ